MPFRACLRLSFATLAAAAPIATMCGLAVAPLGCGGGGDDPAPGKPHFEGDALDAVAQELVDSHNDVRATPAPAPAPALDDLVWDDELAATAQAWANGCKFEHSQGN